MGMVVVYRKAISQRISRLKTSLEELEMELRQQTSSVSYFESLVSRPMDTAAGDDDDTCIICFELMSRLTVTPCGHLFCHDCITSCLTSSGLCPTCRRAVRLDQLVEVKVLLVLTTPLSINSTQTGVLSGIC